MCLDNHFFISADNGILSILCQNINPEKIFEITIHDELNQIDSSSKIFSEVACHLAKGVNQNLLEKKLQKLNLLRI